MAKISVIVPVYKVENFLHRCVDSLLSQSHWDFELILVDDGSPDRCGAICEEYAARDSRVRVLHRENGGLSAARNTGIDWAFANSDSEYLTFVDSDDWVHRDFLKLLAEGVQSTGCPVSVCGFARSGGEPLPEPVETQVLTFSADDYYCGGQRWGSTAIACCKLYRKDLFASLRYPVGKLNEDEFTTYRAIYEAKTVAVIPAALYAYYQNPQGIMLSKWNPRRLHVLEAFRQQIDYAREAGNDRLYRKAVRDLIYGTHEQLAASETDYHRQLRRDYRGALKLGRECGAFPLAWEQLWAYEEAYPAKLFWWPIFKIGGILKK